MTRIIQFGCEDNLRSNGLETKKLLNTGLGWEMSINLIIPVHSSSQVSFLKQNVLHELKLRYTNLEIKRVDKLTKKLCCGFTDNTINIFGRIVVRAQSNGWTCEQTPF